MTLVDKTFKIPEDGVRTPEHVEAILILIYSTSVYIYWYTNKH